MYLKIYTELYKTTSTNFGDTFPTAESFPVTHLCVCFIQLLLILFKKSSATTLNLFLCNRLVFFSCKSQEVTATAVVSDSLVLASEP